MKNLITSMACIMILLVFVLQFVQNQIIHNRMSAVDQAINNFKEVVKQEGCITEKNKNELAEELGNITLQANSDIKISGDKSVIYRGNKIHYIVEVPIEGLISSSEFWGIDKATNKMNYIINRYTTSEFIGR